MPMNTVNKNIFQTPQYISIIEKHFQETIAYLFEQNQHFAIACEVKHLTFTPELPKEIKDTFQEVVLFIMGGYTFETAVLEEDFFLFEAGFGENNFGSHVRLPILAIKQLFVNDTPIIINMASALTKKSPSSQESSMQALLNNPQNKRLLQKKKK